MTKEIQSLFSQNTEVSQSLEFRPEINPFLLAARRRDYSAKLFYSLMRESAEDGLDICDIGSTVDVDSSDMPLLNKVINESHQESVINGEYTQYASSWGTIELRQAIADFFSKWGGVTLDPKTEVMVSRGIIDSVEKVIESLDVNHIIIPSMAPCYPETFGLFKGKNIIFAPLDLTTGSFDLAILEQRIKLSEAQKGKVLMYITHPSAPAGTIMSDTFIQNDLIPFLRANRIWLISDSYISSTRFDGKPLRPILSFPGAKDVAVEAITVSKEIGLPGARAGGVAGNEKIIEALRIHAATTIDTIALPSQRLAAKALREIDPAIAGSRIAQELHEKVLPRFSAMNWPVLKPAAGIDMLVSVPPGFIRAGIEDPGLLASVSILRRFGVAFFPCSVFDQEGNGKFFLRLVLKQKEGKIPNALDLLRLNGFDFEADKPIAEDIDFLRHKIDTLDLIKL